MILLALAHRLLAILAIQTSGPAMSTGVGVNLECTTNAQRKPAAMENRIPSAQESAKLAARDNSDNDEFGDPSGIPLRAVTLNDDVAKVIEAMVTDAAIQEVVDGAGAARLRRILSSFTGWRLVLGDDPPARVPPLELQLKPNTRPYRCKVRQCSPEKSEFLAKFNAELVKLGWVYENKKSRWACAALPVRKPNSNEYRQTNDYRPVNNMTEGIAGVMPSLQVRLERCKNKKFYAIFDFLKGFWQLPLAKASQEILSYMTDRGVSTPTRVPQGCTDAALHFQSTVEEVLKDYLHDCLLVWIDDLLAFADSATELLDVIEAILTKLDEYGFKLNPKKCRLFLTELRWCGRIISERGIGHDPARIEALQRIPEPTTAAELQQFVCATNWMREGLVDYTRTVRPLHELLDTALHGSRRSKRAAAGIKIEFSAAERTSFEEVKALLSHSATLAYPDPLKQLCLLTDASDTGWGLVVTQVSKWRLDTPIQDQPHELLICMGGTFTGSALNWSVIEKESYPPVHACERLEYLLLRVQGFKIYCDHRNIIHLFTPNKELKKHVRGKLLRCSTKLLEYRYTIEHIEGVNNVWVDVISRWGGKVCRSTSMATANRVTTRKRKRQQEREREADEHRGPRPLDAAGFEWPTLDDIVSAQRGCRAPHTAKADDDGMLRIKGKVWIPQSARELLQQLMIIVHCGANGHRGMHVMETHLRRVFAVDNLSKTVRVFCQQCLLCLHVKDGAIVPRPHSETHFTFERNTTLHWDFLTLGESFGTSRYVLVMKDEATHIVELVRCDGPTSEVAAAAILDWHSRFGIPKLWISDSGSHFTSKVIAELNRRLKARQQFVLAYTPWKNGSVERVNRDIIQVLKALILEFRVSSSDWPYLLPLVQSSINHSPVQSLAHKASIQLFTGLPCPSTLDTVLLRGGKERVTSLPEQRPDLEKKLSHLRSSIHVMHKAVEAERKRQAQRYCNRPHYERAVDFSIGDFVLRSRVDEKLHANKLRITWVGPFRVVAATDYYFTVEHLVTGKTMNDHPSRLKHYADSSLNVSSELINHVSTQGTLLAVDSLVEHRYNTTTQAYEIKVKWQGLEEIDDSWEPVKNLSEDVPQLLQNYVKQASDDNLQLAVANAIKGKRSQRRKPSTEQATA